VLCTCADPLSYRDTFRGRDLLTEPIKYSQFARQLCLPFGTSLSTMAPSVERDSSSLTKEKTDVTVTEKIDDKNRDHTVGSNSDEERLSVLDFGGDSQLPPPPTLTPEQERALYRKVDLRLMPILASMYLLSFLDRGLSPFMCAPSNRLTSHALFRKHRKRQASRPCHTVGSYWKQIQHRPGASRLSLTTLMCFLIWTHDTRPCTSS